MKKIISTMVMGLMVAAAGTMMSVSADAQTRACQTRSHYKYNGHDNGLHKGWNKNKKRGNREYREAYYADRYNDGRNYNNKRYYGNNRPNVYQRHRKAMNIGIGTGAGAILGGLIGGKKGAIIGAAAGAGGGYIVTKVQKPTNHRRY